MSDHAPATSMPNLCADIQEQAEVLLKTIRAANPLALPHLSGAATPTLPSAQTASNIASTSASASASASVSALASRIVSDPAAKAAAPSSTPTSPGKQTRTAASATVSPPRVPPSESDAPAESGSIDEPGFPEVGLVHASPRMVQTLMLQCLLPCLSPDHDFGQLMYAPWLHYLVVGAGKLLDKCTEGVQQAAVVLHMLPRLQLAGESCFVNCPFCVPCHLMITSAPCLKGLSCRATRALQNLATYRCRQRTLTWFLS